MYFNTFQSSNMLLYFPKFSFNSVLNRLICHFFHRYPVSTFCDLRLLLHDTKCAYNFSCETIADDPFRRTFPVISMLTIKMLWMRSKLPKCRPFINNRQKLLKNTESINSGINNYFGILRIYNIVMAWALNLPALCLPRYF